MQQMQEQIQDLLPEAQYAWEDKQEKNDLTTRLAAIESKVDNRPVNHLSSLLYVPLHQDQRH